MKLSTLASVAILAAYLIIFGIVINAVSESYGADSIAMYVAVIALGPVGLLLISTHKGLNGLLKKLDNG